MLFYTKISQISLQIFENNDQNQFYSSQKSLAIQNATMDHFMAVTAFSLYFFPIEQM